MVSLDVDARRRAVAGREQMAEAELKRRLRAREDVAVGHPDVVAALIPEDQALEAEALPEVLPPRILGVEALTHPTYRRVYRRALFLLKRYDHVYRKLTGLDPRVPLETRASLLAEYFIWYVEPRHTRPVDWPGTEDAFCTAWGCTPALLRAVVRTGHFDGLLERYRPAQDLREMVWQVDDANFAFVMGCAKLAATDPAKVPAAFNGAVKNFYQRMGMIDRGTRVNVSVVESGSEAETLDLSERMKRLLPYAQKLGLLPEPTEG